MKIRIDPHTIARAGERGTNKTEIEGVIETVISIPARSGRIRKAKIYAFNQERMGKRYAQKRVEVVYVMEEDIAVTVTAYVFFGEWKEER